MDSLAGVCMHWSEWLWVILVIVIICHLRFVQRYILFLGKINGPIGHSVDTAAVIGTIFGIATTCGIGVVQLNYGLHVLFDLPENLWVQTALILVAVIITIISVTSGVNKGLRILSEVNIYVSVGLMLFILFLGNTEFLLNALVQNVGTI